MTENEILVEQKLKAFALFCYLLHGREIELPSDNFFDISKDNNTEGLSAGLEKFRIQYGYPQFGSITLVFDINTDPSIAFDAENKVDLKSYSIYAEAKKDHMDYDYVKEEENGSYSEKDIERLHSNASGMNNVNFNINFDSETETKKFSSINEIAESPNAVQVLDNGITDITNARVINLESPTIQKTPNA